MARFCWCLFVLLFASNTLAIPGPPHILNINQLDAIPQDQDLHTNTSAAVAKLLNPQHFEADEEITFRVPNTPTTLRFELKSETLERAAMAHAILRVQLRLRRFFASHYQASNDVLFSSDDPYMSDPFYSGCFFAVTHYPLDRQKRLTYGMVDNVLKGIWERLYRGERFQCADFYVTDDALGDVGFGRLLRESPEQSSGDTTTEA